MTIPLALLFAFICLDLQKASANLLSIGAVDFGILVDGAVVMVENIFRQLALRKGTRLNVLEIVKDAAAEVDRPLFYAVAVIVASFLPIYVLAGPSGTLFKPMADLCSGRPSGTLFKPMADTMVFALIGSLIVTLTLLPCAVRVVHAQRRARAPQRRVEAVKSVYTKGLDFLSHASVGDDIRLGDFAGRFAAAHPRIGAEFMPQLDEGALWVRATMLTPFPSMNPRRSPRRFAPVLKSFPEVTTVASELGRPDDGTDSHRLFQRRILRRPETLFGMDRRVSHQSKTN